MASVTAVLFDADGVLQLAPDYLHLGLAEAMGRPSHESQACMAAVYEAEHPALTGAARFEDGLAEVLARLGATCDPQTVIRHWSTIGVDAEAMALVARLRTAGVWCALASNQERNRARHMSEVLGHGRAFDREFYSCDVGHAKPSAAYFQAVIAAAGLDPARTLFIDDRADNVEGARSCGLQAEQFVLWQAPGGAKALEALLARHGLLVGEVA